MLKEFVSRDAVLAEPSRELLETLGTTDLHGSLNLDHCTTKSCDVYSKNQQNLSLLPNLVEWFSSLTRRYSHILQSIKRLTCPVKSVVQCHFAVFSAGKVKGFSGWLGGDHNWRRPFI